MLWKRRDRGGGKGQGGGNWKRRREGVGKE